MDCCAISPHVNALVSAGFGLVGVALDSHLADEVLVLEFYIPPERLGPPVGKWVGIDTIKNDLECVAHGSNFTLGVLGDQRLVMGGAQSDIPPRNVRRYRE